MPRTENFLFGRDPIGIYAFQEALDFTVDTPINMASKPCWYGKQDGSGDEITEALYVEPEKLHTQNAPGIRSLDDLGRMIVLGFHNLDASRVVTGFVQIARVNIGAAFDVGPQIPFTLGNIDSSDEGAGLTITAIDNPLPSDFGQISGGGDVNDQLFIRPNITFSGGIDAVALTYVTVLMVSGAVATQAFPHRGVVDSERRFW